MTLTLIAVAAGPHADPPAGPRGAPLEFVGAGPIGVWVSTTPESEAHRDDVFEHHRVVEELCARQPCLPIRFGSRVASAEDARVRLSERATELAGLLERVGSRRELAVTLLWRDSAAMPGRGHDVDQAATGRSFLERKRALYDAADERLRAAEDLGRRLESELATDQADVRHAYCPSPEIALSMSVLAPAGGEEALKARAVQVASSLAGVRAVVSGPWPPYTFAANT